MSTLPSAIRIAQAVGITGSAFCAGGILCISYLHVPSILLAPSPINVRQWKHSFDTGKAVQPVIAVVSGLAYMYLSYSLYGGLNHPKAEMYAVSAILTLGLIPYTIIGLMPTNKKLFKKVEETKDLSVQEKATEVGVPKGESTKELIDHWATLNFVRGVLPLLGASLGAWTTVS